MIVLDGAKARGIYTLPITGNHPSYIKIKEMIKNVLI